MRVHKDTLARALDEPDHVLEQVGKHLSLDVKLGGLVIVVVGRVLCKCHWRQLLVLEILCNFVCKVVDLGQKVCQGGIVSHCEGIGSTPLGEKRY